MCKSLQGIKVDKTVDKVLSQTLFEQWVLPAQSGVKNRWDNAFFILPHLPGATYIEGWGVLHKGFNLFEHAWLEYEDKIVDPSLWQRKVAYFPGLYFSLDEAQGEFSRKQGFPLAHHQSGDKPNSPANSNLPAYWGAWEAAMQFAEAQKRGDIWSRWNKL